MIGACTHSAFRTTGLADSGLQALFQQHISGGDYLSRCSTVGPHSTYRLSDSAQPCSKSGSLDSLDAALFIRQFATRRDLLYKLWNFGISKSRSGTDV